MKAGFQPGDIRRHSYEITETDFATFQSGTVHEVCSTFALAREMEWSSRLFVLDMKEPHEEGVGTELEIVHHSPAFLGELLQFTATINSLKDHELICDIEVRVNDRLVATGKTGQKILNKEKVSQIFTRLGE